MAATVTLVSFNNQPPLSGAEYDGLYTWLSSPQTLTDNTPVEYTNGTYRITYSHNDNVLVIEAYDGGAWNVTLTYSFSATVTSNFRYSNHFEFASDTLNRGDDRSYFLTPSSQSMTAVFAAGAVSVTLIGGTPNTTVSWPQVNPGGVDFPITTLIYYRGSSSNPHKGGADVTQSLGTGVTSFDDNLTSSGTYYFVIEASVISAGVLSSVLKTGSYVYSAPPPVSPPGVPASLATANATTTQFQVQFAAPSTDGGAAITRYYIQINTSNSWGSPLASNELNAPFSVPPYVSIPFAGLTPSTTYYYRVGAENTAGTTYTDGSANLTLSSGGVGGGGDPYVSTANGASYKLPTMDGAIRFYQGEVDGETLTVNATLRTISSTELLAYNLRSMINMKDKMSAKALARYTAGLSKEETLCFFESAYVKHGDRELAANLWDGKIKIQKYVGHFDAKLVDGGEAALKGSGIYSNYKGTTLSVRAGSATIQLSTYLSPIVRSGITVDAPNMRSGNGVLVNILSSSDMMVKSLEDVETVVAKKDTTKVRVAREVFTDHAGTRMKNIVKVL